MAESLLVLAVTLTGVLVTLGAYYILSVSWPRLYFGPADGLEMFLSSRFTVFAAFRILPVTLFSGISSSYASIVSGGAEPSSAIIFVVAYGAFVATSQIAHRVRHKRRINLPDVLWVSTSISLAGIGVVTGYFLAPIITPLLPDFSVLRDAVLTAALVAAILGAAQRFGLHGDYTDRAIGKAISEHASTTKLIESESRLRNIDRWLFSAVYIAEQLQRPRWFQGMERVLYSLGAPVTVGAFQTRSRSSGSAQAEVVNYLDKSASASFASTFGGLDTSRAHSVASMTFSIHNNSKPFVDLCMDIHRRLIRNEFDGSYALSWTRDFGIEIGALQISRYSSYAFSFSVHARTDNRNSVYLTLGPESNEENLDRLSLLPGETRQVDIRRHQLAQQWILRVKGDDSVEDADRKFIPLDELGFETRWEG